MLRHVALFALLVFLPLMPYAQAQETDGARQFVDQVGQKVLIIVNGSEPQEQKQQQLRQMFTQNVDMDWMGRFVLGAAWNKASEDQKSRYLQAYREYLLARYTTNFSEYTGSNYSITGTKNEADGQVVVSMAVKSPKASQQDTQAGYRVHVEGGQFKIIDIIIEGVSLLTTQRSEFSSTVQQSGIDVLITQLQEKTKTKAS